MEGSDGPLASSSNSGSGSNDETTTQDQSVGDNTTASNPRETSNSEVDTSESMEIETDQTGVVADVEGGNMEVHLDSTGEPTEEMGMEAGPSNPGKRVKVCHVPPGVHGSRRMTGTTRY